MADLCANRITEERKTWLADHPHGFVAKPTKNKNGSFNLKHWTCLIPGPEGTIWEGGFYKLEMKFPNQYPTVPPNCYFNPPIFHPNVFKNGAICLSILKAEGHWKPSITVKQLLRGIQNMLDNPNISSPANQEAYQIFESDKAKYVETIKDQAKKYNNCTLKI